MMLTKKDIYHVYYYIIYQVKLFVNVYYLLDSAVCLVRLCVLRSYKRVDTITLTL